MSTGIGLPMKGNSMKIRGASIVAGIAISALVLTACGGDNGTSSTDGETGSDAAPSEPVTLSFQALSDQPAAIAVNERIVEEWNDANPDIQVEIVPAGWDGIYDRLITQFNGDAAPDIIHYEAASIVPFARDGYLADLGEYMSDERQADIPDGVLDSVTVDGNLVAYPTELQSYVAFANVGLLEEAGIEIPSGETMTWDELREIADEVTDGDVYGLGWGLRSPTAAFMTMAPGFDGLYFDSEAEDANISIGDGELAIPEIVYEMTYSDETLLPVTLTQSGGEVLASFYAEQIAITIQGSFQAANIANDAPDGLEWTALPPLAGPAGPQQAANPQTLSVSIDSEYVEQAVQFLEFYTGADNLADLNEADALIPATSSAQELLAERMADATGWATILAGGDNFISAPYLYVGPYAQWRDTVATPSFQRYLANEIDTEQLGSELSSGWDTITN